MSNPCPTSCDCESLIERVACLESIVDALKTNVTTLFTFVNSSVPALRIARASDVQSVGDSTVLVNSTHLTLPTVDGTTYRFKALVQLDVEDAATGYKLNVFCSGATLRLTHKVFAYNSGTPASSGNLQNDVSMVSQVEGAFTAGTDMAWWECEGEIVATGNPVVIQFAKNTAGSALLLSISVGSEIRLIG